MNSYQQKITEFFNHKVIAIAGVSRNPKGEVGNLIYKKFKDEGFNVFPINPNADVIEGDKCYTDLKSLPKKVEAVLIATNPKISVDVVKQCIETGVKVVWFHHSFGNGSFSEEAAKLGEENGLIVIRSGCPMMFIKNADFGHRLIAFFMRTFGKLKQ
jgi:predicted CoA-binding protein